MPLGPARPCSPRRRLVRLVKMLQTVLVLSQEQDLAGLHAYDPG